MSNLVHLYTFRSWYRFLRVEDLKNCSSISLSTLKALQKLAITKSELYPPTRIFFFFIFYLFPPDTVATAFEPASYQRWVALYFRTNCENKLSVLSGTQNLTRILNLCSFPLKLATLSATAEKQVMEVAHLICLLNSTKKAKSLQLSFFFQ